MANPVDQWREEHKHLPPFMRDFHDQKDLFKAIHQTMKDTHGVDWVAGQIYVIDIFLWWMAKRGYTLQRNRTKLPFNDIQADIAAETKRRDDQFTAMLSDTLTPIASPAEPLS